MTISNSTILFSLGIIRISATIGIFLFHILGLYKLNNTHIDFICISAFCFLSLSGYFIPAQENLNIQWIKKKFLKILIPYWIVIIPVITINNITQYKNTTLFQDFLTLSGLSLFVDNPIYVISWYITYILLLYLSIYFIESAKNINIKIINIIITIFIFKFLLHKEYYFYFFILAYYIKNFSLKKETNYQLSNNLILKTQNLCYHFFLIHGGIVLLLSFLFDNIFFTILIGFAISYTGAIILQYFSKNIIKFFLVN